MKKTIIEIFLVVALYFLLLNPAFTFMGGRHSVMLLWPLVILLCNKRYRGGIDLHRGFFSIWFLLTIYIVFRTVIGGIPQYLINQFLMLLDVLIAYILIRVSSVNNIDMIKVLLIMSCIAGVISIACLFSPSFNDYTKSIQVITNESQIKHTYRGFGIGEGMTFTYGVVLGSITALGICLIKNYKWFVFFIPIIAGAVLINARTGFIPIIISFAFFLISERNLKYYTYIAVFVLLFIFIWATYLEKLIPDDTLIWAMTFFDEIGEGKEGGTAEVLLTSDVWPENSMEWIAGKGFNIFDPVRGDRSDVGYFIELCYGGIIYCVLLVVFVWMLVKPAFKKMPPTCFWTYFISIFLLNLKSEYIARNMAFTFLILIMFYYTQNGIKRVKTKKKSITTIIAKKHEKYSNSVYRVLS